MSVMNDFMTYSDKISGTLSLLRSCYIHTGCALLPELSAGNAQTNCLRWFVSLHGVATSSTDVSASLAEAPL